MASSFTMAYLVIHKEIKHCKELENVIRLITVIKNKAMFYNAPFSEIIDEINKQNEFPKMRFIMQFSEIISEGLSVPEAWQTAVNKSELNLEMYECDTLIRFGREMCNCNKDEITVVADSAIGELREFSKTATEKRNMKSKSTAAITISMGIMIVLMFA